MVNLFTDDECFKIIAKAAFDHVIFLNYEYNL